jgi:hypothetical protein
MDVIAGDVYATCWFDLFDRLIPLGPTLGTSTSTSDAWDAPAITQHGERQIIIGQHATLVGSDATVEAYFVNAYVQVGRAISWINPMTGATTDSGLFTVDRAITATATALTSTFGPRIASIPAPLNSAERSVGSHSVQSKPNSGGTTTTTVTAQSAKYGR